MSKVALMKYGSVGQEFIEAELEAAGFEVVSYRFVQPNAVEMSGEELQEITAGLRSFLERESYEFVFSQNYFSFLAEECRSYGVMYVSWVYDNPCYDLQSDTVLYPTNYIFLFDKSMYEEFRAHGINTVYYLPMAAAVDYYNTLIPDEKKREAFSGDISFVGSLYRSGEAMFAPLESLELYTKGYLEGVIHAQRDVYGHLFLEDMLTPQVLERMGQRMHLELKNVGTRAHERWFYANFYLARKVTALERAEIMEFLSKDFSVKLFTKDDTTLLRGVTSCGAIDFYREAPYVFKCSKINLNITLRSIQSGIPMRAFDVMGCGGFLITNYQADFMEHFVPDEDFVFYNDYEDLRIKAAYYLEHDAERERIARNGYEKVKDNHTYRHRIERILRTVLPQG